MRKSLKGYWLLSWTGLISNIIAIPVIGIIIGTTEHFRSTNLILAISLGWPAAIVGIVAAAGLIAERQWGIILSIVAVSMALTGTLPYGIVRIVAEKNIFSFGGTIIFVSLLNLLALIYWCRPGHRKIRL